MPAFLKLINTDLGAGGDSVLVFLEIVEHPAPSEIHPRHEWVVCRVHLWEDSEGLEFYVEGLEFYVERQHIVEFPQIVN